MIKSIVGAGLIIGLRFVASPSHADSQNAQCFLSVYGRVVLNGKCCVEMSATDDGAKGFLVDLHAESWRACLFNRQHPNNKLRPTYQQKCYGPWINVTEDPPEDGKAKTLSAYWSIEGACHGGDEVSAQKIGEGEFRGDGFSFSWKPVY